MHTIRLLYFVILTTIVWANPIFAQTDSLSSKVIVNHDPKIMELINRRASYYEEKKEMPGFRLQIFFDSGNEARKRATTARTEFIQKYPNVEAYLSFEQPYYKIRVGDFRSRLDAKQFEYKIMRDYPNAFIVPDKIKLPKIE